MCTAGVVEQILRSALGADADLSVKPADAVQAQRLAVTVALGMASASSDASISELQQLCQLQQVQAKEWKAVGIAFVIAAGVFLIVIIGLIAMLAYHRGRDAGHKSAGQQYHVSVMDAEGEPTEKA